MRGHELAVEQREVADPQPGNKPGQRNLRGVGHAAEHGLPEKGTAKLHAIEAAYQFALVPALDRMGMANRVEAERRPLDVGVDPGLVAVRAGEQDLVEGTVAGNLEPA